MAAAAAACSAFSLSASDLAFAAAHSRSPGWTWRRFGVRDRAVDRLVLMRLPVHENRLADDRRIAAKLCLPQAEPGDDQQNAASGPAHNEGNNARVPLDVEGPQFRRLPQEFLLLGPPRGTARPLQKTARSVVARVLRARIFAPFRSAAVTLAEDRGA